MILIHNVHNKRSFLSYYLLCYLNSPLYILEYLETERPLWVHVLHCVCGVGGGEEFCTTVISFRGVFALMFYYPVYRETLEIKDFIEVFFLSFHIQLPSCFPSHSPYSWFPICFFLPPINASIIFIPAKQRCEVTRRAVAASRVGTSSRQVIAVSLATWECFQCGRLVILAKGYVGASWHAHPHSPHFSSAQLDVPAVKNNWACQGWNNFYSSFPRESVKAATKPQKLFSDPGLNGHRQWKFA